MRPRMWLCSRAKGLREDDASAPVGFSEHSAENLRKSRRLNIFCTIEALFEAETIETSRS